MKKNGVIIILSLIVLLSMVSKNNRKNGNLLLSVPIVSLEEAKAYHNVEKGMIIQNRANDELYRYNGVDWKVLSDKKDEHYDKSPDTGRILIDDILQLQGRVTNPSNPQNGMIYYNSMFDRFYIYADGVWLAMSSEPI